MWFLITFPFIGALLAYLFLPARNVAEVETTNDTEESFHKLGVTEESSRLTVGDGFRFGIGFILAIFVVNLFLFMFFGSFLMSLFPGG